MQILSLLKPLWSRDDYWKTQRKKEKGDRFNAMILTPFLIVSDLIVDD